MAVSATDVEHLQDKLAEHRAYVAGFTCPRHKGLPLPCELGPDGLWIPTTSGWSARCPIAEAEQCVPWGVWILQKRADDQTKWDSIAAQVGLPSRLWRAAITDLSTPAMVRARTYLAEEYAVGTCLVLSGATGVGKTWAAAAVLREARCSKQFVFFPALCSALMDSQRRVAALEAAKTTPFVVLDDFGAHYEDKGGFLDSLVYEILWWREANALPTVLTSNLTLERLREVLSDRILDRLRGDWGRVVHLTGASLREPRSTAP